MAENVVFNNQQANTDQFDPNAGAIPQGEQTMQPGADQPMDTQGGSDGEPPAGEEPPAGDETYETPPPTGIAAILGGGRLKKILIGLGVLIILIIIIILIIPKNQRGTDVELKWWGLWEDPATVQPLIDGFEKQNPHIKIIYTKQDPENYRDTLITRINNGSGPDIFRYHNTWTPIFVSALAPLPKDVITTDDFSKEYYTVIQNDLMQNGAIYGIPIGIDSIALFINNDLLKASGQSAPKDWNQFQDLAKAMTARDTTTNKIKIAGAALGTYDNITHAPDLISIMFLQQGANLNKISNETTKLSDALTFYTNFANSDNGVWDSTLDRSELAFAKGQLGMYFGFSWDIFTINQLKTNSNLKFSTLRIQPCKN